MTDILTLKQARAITHSLSAPSKMPWYGYSLPAKNCITGAKLAKHAGTVCSFCYAMKGRYVFPTVQNALKLRLDALRHPRWVEAMTFQIRYHRARFKGKTRPAFRWHDSGDVQGEWHLLKMIEIANKCPEVDFYLPTREMRIVKNVLDMLDNRLPDNFYLRISSSMVGMFEKKRPLGGRPVALVGSDSKEAYHCPAQYQGNKCGDCRACWTNTPVVNYPLH